MPTIRFRNAHIRFADLRHENEAGKFIRLHMTTDFSKPVCEHMNWQDFPESLESGKLSGELTGRNFILTPNGEGLRKHELQLDISDVSDFQVFRIQNKDGESTRTELRFVVRSQQAAGMALIESYIEKIGHGDGALKIAHEKQEGLDFGADDAEEEKPAVEGKGAIASKAEVEQRGFQKGQLTKMQKQAAERKGAELQ